MTSSKLSTPRIGIIGLGYVGLPLAFAFAEKYSVTGYDNNSRRVHELQQGIDNTGELETDLLRSRCLDNNEGTGLFITDDPAGLQHCTTYIITVPTPVDAQQKPDLQFLLSASKLVGSFLKRNDIVIYESTVYPGCTEEDCVPMLEQSSGLVFNTDFFCGYSPERINPGDKKHTLTTIKKVVSGSTAAIASDIDALYASIITAGTYLAPSIRVAEAAKAIENAQRDVNISFMNELALIFDRMGIDTAEVLAAASTKWNFLPFKPGLVGGHCIGVDPHYLAYKAGVLGYEPQVILSGRKVNEYMGVFVAEKLISMLSKAHDGKITGRHVLVLGFAFKENCPDTRNTKVIDICRVLKNEGLQVTLYDPWVNSEAVQQEYGWLPASTLPEKTDAVVVAVAHDVFKTIDLASMKKNGTLIFDTKGILDKGLADARL